ncbi:MAG: PEGA domain-containing protein [Pseudomonadota bacterium]
MGSLVRTVCFSGLMVVAAGCQTLGLDNVRIETTPPDATARFATGQSCKTPCAFRAVGEKPISITLSKTGFKSETVTLTRSTLGFRPNPLRVELQLVAPTINVEAAPLAPAE